MISSLPHSLLIALCFWYILLPSIWALKFDLQAHAGSGGKYPRCIRNFVSRETLVVVTATVGGTKGDGQVVNMLIKDTNDNEYGRPKDIVGEKRLAFTSHTDAAFDVCFENILKGRSVGTNPSRHIELDIDIGADAKDWSAVQAAEKLRPVETELRRIEEMVGEIVNEMDYLRTREQKLRDTNESTNERVKWFAFGTMGMLVGLGAWQVVYLRAYFSVSLGGTDAAEWDKNTWPSFEILPKTIRRPVSTSRVREVPKSELKPDVDNATSFTTVCINTAICLPWLVSQCLKAGVVFKRAVFSHVPEAAAPGIYYSGSRADLLIICTSLSASKLGSVEDQSIMTIRGQIVVVRNDPGGKCSISGTNDGPEEWAFVMMHAAGGGTVLAGSIQKGNWDSQLDPILAIRIMIRCVALCPQLTGRKGIEHLDIIRHGVGLRLSREGGARIGEGKINGTWVVSNYGHDGAGYQYSCGCAQPAVKLV
ncbi:vesicle coat component [Xylographa bjoerkii]|nr:vesicle coat component [Xylographa bjoerkii]